MQERCDAKKGRCPEKDESSLGWGEVVRGSLNAGTHRERQLGVQPLLAGSLLRDQDTTLEVLEFLLL